MDGIECSMYVYAIDCIYIEVTDQILTAFIRLFESFGDIMYSSILTGNWPNKKWR